jgi:hypothetical protein
MLPAEAPADPPARWSALAIVVAVPPSASGLAAGSSPPISAGSAGPPVFFANGPVGIVLVIGALAILPASQRKDLLGAALLLAALMCLIGPLLIGADLAWPAWLVPSAALRIALLWWSQGWAETRAVACRSYISICCAGSRLGLLIAFLLTFANISFYLLITANRWAPGPDARETSAKREGPGGPCHLRRRRLA